MNFELISPFMRNVILGSFLLAGFITNTVERVSRRAPAAAEEGFELTIQSLAFVKGSRLESLHNAYIRAVFNKSEVVEIGKEQTWSIGTGETKRLDQKVELKSTWITDDGLEFKIELVEKGIMESVRLRCSTISKGLSVFNRSYQCSVPGEATAVLTYRVSRKGAPLPDAPNSVAQNF